MVTFFCMGAVVIVYHGEGEYSRVSISIVNGFLCRKWDSALIFIVPPLAGGRWCRRHQRGTGPLGPEGSGGGWRRKLRKRSAANAAGCAEGLCSLRSGSVRERLGVAAAPPQFLAAVWRSVLHSVISTCSVLHPLATSWPSLHGKASHEIFSRLWLPTNSVRLPPLKGAQVFCRLPSFH